MVMRNNKGQFIKGVRSHPDTEFKKGQHWRPHQLFREKTWLVHNYITLGRSTPDIASQFGCYPQAVSFWLKRHGIPTRTMSEVRKRKHWGCSGPDNPMYGKRGSKHPNWQGGTTPFRQALYGQRNWGQFARRIWARDRCCRVCGSKVKCEIHHIRTIGQAPLLVADEGNVILLCYACHLKTRGRESRWCRRLLALLESK